MNKIDYLKKYNSEVKLLRFEELSEVELSNIPQYWKEALSQKNVAETSDSILKEWQRFTYQFQSTIGYLKANLVEVEIISEGNSLALLYTIRNIKGENVYYIGFNPNTKSTPDYFEKLPDSFKDIYNELHNGWVYYASRSNGLLPIEDTIILGNEDWGILEEIDANSLPFSLNSCVGVFDNGMGDFVSINLESTNKSNGFIWWHTKPPKLDLEIWPVIDEWTKIGIER